MPDTLPPSPTTRTKMANLFFVLAILFGLLLIFLEPPFVCPDENAHFLNICHIAHGRLFADTEDGKVGVYMTEEELEFLAAYGGRYNGEGSAQYDLATMTQLTNRPASDSLLFVESDFAALNPIPYLLPALLPFLFHLVGIPLNAYNTLLLAKMVNLLFYAFVIRWALLRTSLFEKTMFLLALMPMAIFQGASTSYDAPLIACSFLLLAYVSKILCAQEQTAVSREDILAICFATFFIVGSKVAYAPLILVLFAIPIKKIGTRKRYFTCIGCVAAVLVLAYVIPTLINTLLTAGYATPPTDLQLQQKEYVRQNILILPQVIFSTTRLFAPSWMRGFFGILGWLDTNFPEPFVLVFWGFLLFFAFVEASCVKGIRWHARALSLAGVAIFFVGTVCTMYIQWNPVLVEVVGGKIAYGGQGRYFIPVAPFVLLGCCSPLLLRARVGERLQDTAQRILPFVSFFYLCLTLLLLVVRYWA